MVLSGRHLLLKGFNSLRKIVFEVLLFVVKLLNLLFLPVLVQVFDFINQLSNLLFIFFDHLLTKMSPLGQLLLNFFVIS